MSIYGPPPREPRRAPGALFSFVRLVIVVVALGALTCVAVFAALDLQRGARKQLEVDRVTLEATRLQTADFLPAIPEPPHIEIPEPLQLQSAEILLPPPAHPEPEPLQTAEILR